MRTYQKALSELFGTFLITGQIATIVTMLDAGVATLTDVAFMLFLSLTVIIYCFAPISGPHLNPSATVMYLAFGEITLPLAIVYIVSQIAGGILGAGMSYLLIPESWKEATRGKSYLGGTTVNENFTVFQAFMAETMVTGFFIFVVWATLLKKHKYNVFGGWAAGAVLGIAIYLLGPITGVGMNPARCFGPAVIMGEFPSDHWLFWVAPTLGAFIGGGLYKFIFYEFDVEYKEVQEVPEKLKQDNNDRSAISLQANAEDRREADEEQNPNREENNSQAEVEGQ